MSLNVLHQVNVQYCDPLFHTEDDIPVTKAPEKSEKDIPLLVIETVGNKAVKQDVLANDKTLRDFVKNSLRKQGMLKQELEVKDHTRDFVILFRKLIFSN